MTRPEATRSVLPRWAGTVLLLLAATVAGWLGARWAAADRQAELALRPPVIVLDLAAVARDSDPVELGAVLARARERAERLAAGGFLVLDAQAVIAAPADLFFTTGGEGAGVNSGGQR